MPVEIKLSTVTPIHREWIMDFYKQMESSGSLVKSRFKKILITKVAMEVEALANLSENLFQKSEIEPGA